ncbi:L-2-hydroxyglutarate oxidase [Halarcobacter bivalviorum]|uniref:L-2-hydroxyglutarate oxidase n=1 Tax=Halarcobacter bivalviorum TaxID=663364 RepID=UPI00100B70B8|nr:L-2-hydroxyglutarate oxidase [Halarcobacter bivalviorum]RXK07196.1 L-2-hydroxyglutarate oxidase [Halarcobacter bivalviorum]
MPYDYLIVGSGIIGMTIAYELKEKEPSLKIAIIDKEEDVAKHASGRNSGVLHAGFYYTSNSLKAKFTVDGNRLMKEFCKKNNIFVNETQKIVVAKNETELEGIYELQRRAEVNGVETKIISEDEVSKTDPNIKTYKKALFSPNTASVDPKDVCFKLKEVLKEKGISFYFNTSFDDCNLKYKYLINCAGVYADKIAQKFGLAKDYTLLPFKGIYLKYITNKSDIKTNIYPVPNLANPFLGVHYTITVDGSIKIGPTAIPAFWRENYKGFSNFNFKEMIEILYFETKLFIQNSFNFRRLAIEEMKNYRSHIFIQKAKDMVKSIGNDFKPIPAGIRAQLLNKKTNELVQDFVLEHNKSSTHILNAVSPAFTCSFAFAKYVVSEIEKNKGNNNE